MYKQQINDSTKMNLLDRLQAPTPKFFKSIRTLGICLAAIGGAIVSAPVALPAILSTVAGYLIVAGTSITAVCQATVKDVE